MILIEKGDLKKGLKAASEARKIFDEIHCNYLKPQLLLAEGALAHAEHSDTAEFKLKEALKTSKKMFTREFTWQIQRELALHNIDKGELHKALQYYRDAIDMIKEITETIDGEELKTSYLSLPFRKRVFDEIKALKKQL
jgi:tetratricopeptide (TPR) repeat protein